MSALRIAVVGFGFSGLMVTAHLVRMAAPGTLVYVIGEDLNAQGVAYRTTNLQHLLNVPAGRMGAFADAIEDFHQWLHTLDGALARQRLGIDTDYSAADFVPRALYAQYLAHIWRGVQETAAARGVMLKLVESHAVMLADRGGLAVLTARGDAIAVDRVVLATGNETKPILRNMVQAQVIQDPWAPEVFSGAAAWAAPVMLMGTGLTAVDTVLGLRAAGYAGEIIAFSRHGLLPQVHQGAASLFAFEKDVLLLQSSLGAMVRMVRAAITRHGEWRPVIDALRPVTQALWQRLALRDQRRFLSQLLTLWNVHRHRMAPEIAARMEEEIACGGLRIVACQRFEARLEEEQLQMVLHGRAVLAPSRLVNCTGPQMAVEKSAYPLLVQAVADGVIEPHATGLGIALDHSLRAWGVMYPQVYVIGTLATGQLLESTAVPELRVQAMEVAQSVLGLV